MALTNYDYLYKAPAEGAPLVFAVHGTGGSEQQIYRLVEQILPQAGIVAARGDVSEHGANRFFRRTSEGVYDMDDLAGRTVKMAAFICAHAERHRPTSIVGLGYSNGANILASVLFNTTGLFHRVVLMHPLIPFTPAASPDLARLEVLITAGRRDPICPAPLTEALERYFRTQGASVTLNMHDGGHDVRQIELDAIAAFLTRAC